MPRRTPDLHHLPILGIDPGPERSAFVLLDAEGVRAVEICEGMPKGAAPEDCLVAIEVPQPRGNRMSYALMQTALTAGWYLSLYQLQPRGCLAITPSEVYRAIGAKDKAGLGVVIRDLYGDTDRDAYGTKEDPGPLYKIRRSGVTGASDHLRSALAVALAIGMGGRIYSYTAPQRVVEHSEWGRDVG